MTSYKTESFVDEEESEYNFTHASNRTDENTAKDQKNPKVLLNDIRRGLKFNLVSKTGLDHAPTFTVAVNVNDQVAVGSGTTIKGAKLNAAKEALRVLKVPGYIDGVQEDTGRQEVNSAHTSESLGHEITESKINITKNQKNAKVLLNDIRRGLKFNLVSKTGPDHAPTFIVDVNVDDQVVVGSGRTMKEAKLNAAKEALQVLKVPGYVNEVQEDMGRQAGNSDPTRERCGYENTGNKDHTAQDQKNDKVLLNDVKRGEKFNMVSNTGPDYAAAFTVALHLNDQVTVGSGGTQAKLNASKEALQVLKVPACVDKVQEYLGWQAGNSYHPSERFGHGNTRSKVHTVKDEKNTKVMLKDIRRDLKSNLVSFPGQYNAQAFTVAVHVNDQLAVAIGKMLNQAKLNAFKEALEVLKVPWYVDEVQGDIGWQARNSDRTSDSFRHENTRSNVHFVKDEKKAKVLLSYMRRGLKFNLVSFAGQCKAETFTVAVHVNDQLDVGIEKVLKQPKLNASKEALQVLKLPWYVDEVQEDTGRQAENSDHTSDSFRHEKTVSKVHTAKNKKNYKVLLNDARRGLKFNVVSKTGPDHAPTFTVAVHVNGQVAFGSGRTIKEAKLNAAKEALQVLKVSGYVNKVQEDAGRQAESSDHTNQSFEHENAGIKINTSKNQKNAKVLLNDIRRGLKFNLVSKTGPDHAPTFTVAGNVNDQMAVGSGRTLKEAKLNATKEALQVLKVPWYEVQEDIGRQEGRLDHKNESFGRENTGRKVHTVKDQKNAKVLLNDTRRGLKFNLVSKTGPDNAPTFTVAVNVNDQVAVGSGRTIKEAKLNAAKEALQVLKVPGYVNELQEDTGRQEGRSDHKNESFGREETTATFITNNTSSLAEEYTATYNVPPENIVSLKTDVTTQTEEFSSVTSKKKGGRHLRILRRVCSCFTECFSRRKS